MKTMRSARLGLCLVVFTTASCGFPRLSELVDGGGGGGGGSDGATSDGEPLPLDLELLAGDIGGSGNADGTGAAARFNDPSGVAVDSAGNVYVADRFNHSIRKVTPDGVVTTLAGTARSFGSEDGTGAAAHFFVPTDVAVDGAGNVYVAEQGDQTIRKVTPDGVVTTLAGTAPWPGSADGTGPAARFNDPTGVAVDSAGNVYVADQGNQTIRKVTPDGVVTTLVGAVGMAGSADGMGAAARFNNPSGVAVDRDRNIYVADQGNQTIRKVTPDGVVTTLAGAPGMAGSADGTGTAARFYKPFSVAVDTASNVYVADQGNHTIRKVTPAGDVTTLVGTAGISGSVDGTGAATRFHLPTGVAVDSAGNIYIGDQGNHTIRKVTSAEVVTTLAGATGRSGSTDGVGASARFFTPIGVAVDSAGNIYVADGSNQTIRKVTTAGGVATLAGAAGISGSVDGTGTAARFYLPDDVAVDSVGNVYVADQGNHTIRKITATGVVTTLAGTAGIAGSADGTGAAARFYYPTGVAVDGAGNVYVADRGNSTIRKITAAGVVTTLAGTVGMLGSADGPGVAAGFYYPTSVAVDSAGNVYVADQGNRTIRKITATGVVTTLASIAGTSGSVDGAGAAARFGDPTGVAVDSAGNIYVTDTSNSTIRKVTPIGTTTTIAGAIGVAGIFLGTTPRFAFPQRLAIVGDSIVISDTNAFALTDTSAILLLRHGAQ